MNTKITKKNIEKLETGIKGFDQMLGGGIPKGRIVLITGEPGSGKTNFLNEFIYRGIMKYGQNSIFVTFEEEPEDIIKNVRSFGWDYEKLIKENKLRFINFDTYEGIIADDYDFTPIILRIKNAIEDIHAERVAIDSIGTLFLNYDNAAIVRKLVIELSRELKSLGVTTLLTSERVAGTGMLTRFGVEEFVADGFILLSMEEGENEIIKRIHTRKMRGMGFRNSKVYFNISDEGITVYPKIPRYSSVKETSFKKRLKFGIEKLDKALGGGIPEGHIILLGGNTGTGKTILSMQFLIEGLINSQNAVWVALEETLPQLRKTAKSHGWDLKKFEDEKKLKIIPVSLLDISPDKLLYEIIDYCEEMDVKRLAFDSISSMLSAVMNRDRIREFFIQLNLYIKSKGITSINTYLTASSFSALAGQLLGESAATDLSLSSIMDVIMILRYVERKQKIERLFNILKLRGSNHSKDIFKYEIVKGGMKVIEKFRE